MVSIPPLSSEQKEVLYVLSYTFIQHNQPFKAVVLLEALAVLFPDDLMIAKALSYGYLKTQRFDDALALIERLWSQVAPDERTLLALLQAQALWGLERMDEVPHYLQYLVSPLPSPGK